MNVTLLLASISSCGLIISPKTDVFHSPCSCPDCKGNEDGKQMKSMGIRGSESEEERTGGASRVEGTVLALATLVISST